MNSQSSIMKPEEQDRDKANLRLGMILGAVALTLFFGYILRYWLMGR